MTIDINERDHYVGIWFAAAPDDGVDFLAVAWREPGSAKVQARFRFRYYNDGRVFDSQDEKSWYTLSAERTDDDFIAMFDGVVDEAIARSGAARFDPLWRRVHVGDGRALMKAIASCPAMHMMREGAPDPDPNTPRGAA